MKKNLLLIVITLVFFQKIEAQITVKNDKIVYEHIYKIDTTKIDSTKICDAIRLNQKYENLKESNNSFSFKILKDQIDLKKYGLKRISTPMYVMYDYYYNAIITVTKSQYTVKVSNITMNYPEINTVTKTIVGMEQISDSGTIEDQFVKDGKLKDSNQVKKYIPIFEKYFEDTFLISE